MTLIVKKCLSIKKYRHYEWLYLLKCDKMYNFAFVQNKKQSN